MTRALLPGRWNRDGRAIPDGCRCQTEAFNCSQGRACPLNEPVKAEPTKAASSVRAWTWSAVAIVLPVFWVALFVACFAAGWHQGMQP